MNKFINWLKSNYRKPAFLLFIIIIIASFLRLYNITQTPPGLYPDEAMNGNNAFEALSPNGHFKIFYPENNGREGLFMNIQAISIAIFGNTPWALRLVSALFGIFTVLGVYFLTKILFENRNYESRIMNQGDHMDSNSKFKIQNSKFIPLLSAFLLATSFWHINFSRIGFRAIMAPFFLVWALYFIIRAIKNNNPPTPFLKGGYKKMAIWGGVFFGLGFYSYIAFRPMPLLILLALAYYWITNKDLIIRHRIIRSLVYFIIATFIVALPLGIYFLNHPADFFGRTSQISIFSSSNPAISLLSNVFKTLAMFNFKGDGNWRHNLAGRPELFWPVGIIFIIGFIFGIYRLLKKSTVRQFHLDHTPGAISTPAPIALKPTPITTQNPTGDPALASKPVTKESIAEVFQSMNLGQNNSENISTSSNVFVNADLKETAENNLANNKKLDAVDSAQTIIEKEQKFGFFVLFSWLIIAALPVVISSEGIPHALRAIIMIPPVFILAGFGGILFYNWLLKYNWFVKSQRFLISIILIFLFLEAYHTYFISWGMDPNTLGAFSQNYVDLGNQLNEMPNDMPKYVIVNAGGTDVRGLPMPTQTVMYITDTFTPEKQAAKNLHYILPGQENQIPKDAFVINLE